MTTRFDRKDEREREFSKMLLAVIFFFITSILCIGIILALNDWHNNLWMFGIK
jgi:hypothetical protein